MNAVVDVEVNAVFDVDLLYFLRSLTKVGKYGQFMRHSFNGLYLYFCLHFSIAMTMAN